MDAQERAPQEGKAGRNPILDAIVAVVENGEDASRVRDIAGRARTELVELRQEVGAGYHALAPNLQAAAANEYQQVLNALGVYEEGLDFIDEYLQNGDVQTLIRGGERVRRGNHLTNQMLLAFRNATLLAMGPSDIPDYNLLHQHYERVRRGEAPRDGAFAAVVFRFREACGAAGEVCFRQEPSEVRDQMLDVYRRHMAAFNLLKAYILEGRSELLEKGMADVRESFAALRDAIPAAQMKLRSSAPTRMPTANFVINMAVEVAAGNISDVPLKDALEQLRKLYDDMRRQFEAVARGHIDSVLIAEEAEKVRECFHEIETAIEEFDMYFETRRGVLLGSATGRLREGVDRLWESHEVFMDLAEREGKTLCIRCNHYNEKSRRTCEKCGAKLLQAAETGVASTFQVNVGDQSESTGVQSEDVPVPENVRRIFLAVNSVSDGEITPEEFEAEVAWLEGVVEQNAAAYGSRPVIKMETVPAEQKEEVERLKRLTDEADENVQQGAADYRQGLALFREYLQDGNKDNLTEGCRQIWEGTRKLHRVQTSLAFLQEKAGSTPSS